MTTLAALNKKCPDFEKIMEYLPPGSFKDAKAARNRWERLIRDNKNSGGGSAPSTPKKSKAGKQDKVLDVEGADTGIVKNEGGTPSRKRLRQGGSVVTYRETDCEDLAYAEGHGPLAKMEDDVFGI